MNNYINSKHHLAEPCGNTMNTKEPAVIEQAINRLKAVVTENRILSHEIADNVFHDRGVGANSPEPVVLPGIIDDISQASKEQCAGHGHGKDLGIRILPRKRKR